MNPQPDTNDEEGCSVPATDDGGSLLMVTERIAGAHPKHTNYPLLEGDVLTRDPDGTYIKHTGICVFGFVLTPEQAATLKPVTGRIVMT